jgi:hypothetical protein
MTRLKVTEKLVNQYRPVLLAPHRSQEVLLFCEWRMRGGVNAEAHANMELRMVFRVVK